MADEKAPLIWENMNKLIARYGFELDIVFDDAKLSRQIFDDLCVECHNQIVLAIRCPDHSVLS